MIAVRHYQDTRPPALSQDVTTPQRTGKSGGSLIFTQNALGGNAVRDSQALLGKHEFLTGVAGHASAGNLHFLLTPTLSEPADRDRYESFMTGLVELVVDKYDGSLKAEHGTGRNMAPYVEREWGPKAT